MHYKLQQASCDTKEVEVCMRTLAFACFPKMYNYSANSLFTGPVFHGLSQKE